MKFTDIFIKFAMLSCGNMKIFITNSLFDKTATFDNGLF